MDMPIKVEANLTPAIEASSKGVGKIMGVLLGKKIMKFEYQNAMNQAQIERDKQLIANGAAEYRDGSLIILSGGNDNPLLISDIMKANMEDNASKSLSHAIEILESEPDEEISDEPLSETFFLNWHQHASKISEDDIHRLWGEILASEVRSGGSSSLQMMNVMSLMDKRMLLIVQRLSKYISGDVLIFSDIEGSYHIPDITKSEFNELVDVGLIRSSGPDNFRFSMAFEKKDNFKIISWGADNDYWLAVESDKDLSVFYKDLTFSGSSLIKIAQTNIDLKDSVKSYAKYLLTTKEFIENKITKITVFKINANVAEPIFIVNK